MCISESVDEESETVESEDNTSFSSPSPRKKKRKIENENESGNEVTTNEGPPVECEISNNKMSNSQKKTKSDTKKQIHEIEFDNSTYDEHESKYESSIKRRSRAVKDNYCNQSTNTEKEQSNKDTNKTGKSRISKGCSSDDEREQTDCGKPELNAEDKLLESSSSDAISKDEEDDQIVTKQKKQKAKVK